LGYIIKFGSRRESLNQVRKPVYLQMIYLQARKSVGVISGIGLARAIVDCKCNQCGEVGHIQKNCPKESNSVGARTMTKPTEIKCYNCGTKGHIVMHCPYLYAGSSKGDFSGPMGIVRQGSRC